MTDSMKKFINSYDRTKRQVDELQEEERVMCGMSEESKRNYALEVYTPFGTSLWLDFDQTLELVKSNWNKESEELRRLETLLGNVEDVLGEEFCDG